MSPVDWNRFEAAMALKAEGKFEEARAEIRALEGRATDPDEKATLLANEVTCLRLQGRHDEAWGPLREALRLLPQSSQTYPLLLYIEARLLYEQRKGQEALKKFHYLLSHYGETLQSPEQQSLYQDVQRDHGHLLVQLDRPAEARPILEKAVLWDYDKEMTCYFLGVCYFDLGEFELARERFVEAIQLGVGGEHKPWAHYYLGLIHYALGAYAWAKKEFEASLAHTEHSTFPGQYAFKNLAKTCRALGLEDEAKRYEELAQGTGP